MLVLVSRHHFHNLNHNHNRNLKRVFKMQDTFDHEKLHIYKAALEFLKWLQEQKNMERIPKGLAVYGHLDRASASSPLNIAEGNGKFTQRDRCKYFDIARGSTLECAAALDILVAKSILTEDEIVPGKKILHSMVSMLVGLIRSNSSERVYDSQASYEWEI